MGARAQDLWRPVCRDMKRIVILGATGSIGDSTFKALAGLEESYTVVGLSGGRQVDKLIAAARRWQVQRVCVAEGDDVARVEQALPEVEVSHGEEGLVGLAVGEDVDLVVNALVGAVGLSATLAAVRSGVDVAMANKEPLVMAGGLILDEARAHGVTVLPLDSEPNAIWQCLKGESRGELARILLTASGGPFFGWSRERMREITPSQALDHPTWTMGPKITVDSATLMNKGFEVIEASWLFGVGIDQIEVVIHRESIVHSIVEFCDGAMLAHLGRTDMVLPIRYALTHPERAAPLLERLDLAAVGRLTFAGPDRQEFGCLDQCYAAGRAGGTVPTSLNAANEIAVAAILSGRIGFLDIEAINGFVLERALAGVGDGTGTLAGIMAADAQAREWALAATDTRQR